MSRNQLRIQILQEGTPFVGRHDPQRRLRDTRSIERLSELMEDPDEEMWRGSVVEDNSIRAVVNTFLRRFCYFCNLCNVRMRVRRARSLPPSCLCVDTCCCCSCLFLHLIVVADDKSFIPITLISVQ